MLKKLRELGAAPVATCVIVRGELMFMAQKSERKVENLRVVHDFFKEILVYPIDEMAADQYGALKGAALDYFGPKDKTQRRKIDLAKLGFGENDLWIAAIAQRYDLTIVSADRDFLRLQAIAPLIVETWWTPEMD